MPEARLLRPVAGAAHVVEVIAADAEDAGNVVAGEKFVHRERVAGGRVSTMPIIRSGRQPNLDVILSNTGFEPYADKQARIAGLLEAGRQAELEEAAARAAAEWDSRPDA